MWVKICGVRDLETARRIAACGADAIGLNFYAPSPRCVSPEAAAKIANALSESDCEPVGLFVNHVLEDVCALCRSCPIHTVQLHGDEPPEFVRELAERLPGVRVIRAFRVTDGDLAPVREFSEACRRLGSPLWAALVDAHTQAVYGGSGQTLDWPSLASAWTHVQETRMILAGGLTPANVAKAIAAVHPWGVDTASGVERSPGAKDLELVRQFLDRARQAG